MTRIGLNTGRTPMDNARRFLEEALILRPSLHKARYYLGLYHHRNDRPDEAQAEYRRILNGKDLELSLRALALQAMGNAYAYRRDYRQAVACYDQILEERLVDRDPKFFHVHVGLAMHLAKAGQFQRSKQIFGELVTKHPERLAEARTILDQAEVFRNLLREESGFHMELRERYPMLFAG